MKLSILGGGGSRAIILAKSLLQKAPELGIDEIVFMDSNEENLRIFGGMAQKAASIIDPKVLVTCTSDAVTAITDSDYIITTVRVGGDTGRVENERIALNYGVLGQETTGAGGFAMAMRTIPVLKEYCELIRKFAAKDVMVFNFSNPSGLVTQAMRDLGYHFVYGVCDAPSSFLNQVARMRKAPGGEFEMDVFGLNHLSYYTAIRQNGRDITEELLGYQKLFTETDMRYFEPELPRKWGVLFNEYLYYFYYREKAVLNILSSKYTRGESILNINLRMIQDLKDLNPENDTDFSKMLDLYANYNHQREISYMASESSIRRNETAAPKFDLFSPEEGGYAGIALAFIKAKQLGKRSEMVLSVPNNGSVDWLNDDDVIETTCLIGPEGAETKKNMRTLPDSAKVLIQTMKQYERLAARGILEQNKEMAVEALMVHPLINSYSLAKDIAGAYWNTIGTGDWRKA